MAILKNTVINGTGSLNLPSGTQAQRTSPANGMMRFNSSTRTSEIYNPSSTTTSVWASTAGVDIVKSGLIAWYDFGDLTSYPQGGSSTISNLCNAYYTGSIHNGPLFDGANLGYMTFNGTNHHISINNSVTDFTWTPNGAVGNQSISVDMWIRSSDTSGVFFTKPWNGAGQYNQWIFPNQWYIANDVAAATIGFERNLSDGTWTHIITWANSTQIGYYINGGQYSGTTSHGLTGGQIPSGGLSEPAGIMTLYPYGSGWAGESGFSIAGNLAIFRYYKNTLTAAQAYQNFSAERHRFNV
jgi:hypothetical protein